MGLIGYNWIDHWRPSNHLPCSAGVKSLLRRRVLRLLLALPIWYLSKILRPKIWGLDGGNLEDSTRLFIWQTSKEEMDCDILKKLFSMKNVLSFYKGLSISFSLDCNCSHKFVNKNQPWHFLIACLTCLTNLTLNHTHFLKQILPKIRSKNPLNAH